MDESMVSGAEEAAPMPAAVVSSDVDICSSGLGDPPPVSELPGDPEDPSSEKLGYLALALLPPPIPTRLLTSSEMLRDIFLPPLRAA